MATPFPAVAATAPSPASGPDIFGVWRNVKETVHVDIEPCGPFACGVVVWANAEATATVKRVSGKELLGLQLFRDMSKSDTGVWHGRGYVPDLNMTFNGFAQTVSATVLRVKGCLIGGFLCKTQVWTRVS